MSRWRFPHRTTTWATTYATIALVGSLVGACQSKTESPPRQEPGSSEPTAREATDSSVGTYGQPLSLQESLRLADLVAAPEQHAGKTVLVEGKVRRACSAKGCWLELATEEKPDAPACRVTFKDYAFFVPTDSAGATARVQGVVEVTRVKKSHVEHLEGEGATFEKKSDDGTATELRVVATGVELRRG